MTKCEYPKKRFKDMGGDEKKEGEWEEEEEETRGKEREEKKKSIPRAPWILLVFSRIIFCQAGNTAGTVTVGSPFSLWGNEGKAGEREKLW